MRFKKMLSLVITSAFIFNGSIAFAGDYRVRDLLVNEKPIYTEMPDWYSSLQPPEGDLTAGLADQYNINNSEMITPPKQKTGTKPSENRKFIVVDFTNNQARYEINAKLKYIGENSIVYVGENDKTSEDVLKETFETLDKKMFPFVHNKFTKPTDVDGNGKTIVLIYDIKDNYDKSGGYTAGYFNSADLYRVNNSNRGEVIYIDSYPNKLSEIEGSTTIVHEYQHLVQHSSKVPKDTWMNEGMSMLAEQLYSGKALDGRISSGMQYYGAYDNKSLMNWVYDNWEVFANYGLSYTFFAYLHAQLGDVFIKDYYNSPYHDFRALEYSINKYEKGMTVGEFITNYNLALIFNHKSGKYSFKCPGFEELYTNPANGGSYSELKPTASIYGFSGLNSNSNLDESIRVVKTYNNNIYKPEVKVKELIGSDRYQTNIKVLNESTKGENLILVDNKDPMYGLIASSLASQTNSDILLYKDIKEINDFINSRDYKKIYLIGNVNYKTSKDVEVIKGKDLTETSYMIANKINQSDKAILVNGERGDSDALSSVSISSEKHIPIISVKENMDKKIIDKINSYKEIIVVGGENTVTPNMLKGIDNSKITRIAGDDRYETNALVLNKFYKRGFDNMLVSKGWELIDSSISGNLSKTMKSPIILVSKNGLNSIQKRYLGMSSYKNAYIIGGGVDKEIINNQIVKH